MITRENVVTEYNCYSEVLSADIKLCKRLRRDDRYEKLAAYVVTIRRNSPDRYGFMPGKLEPYKPGDKIETVQEFRERVETAADQYVEDVNSLLPSVKPTFWEKWWSPWFRK